MDAPIQVALTLLDRLILDLKGEPLGRVDDLELTDGGEGPPRLTALLCGPLALGPRLDHKWGEVWASVGQRLRGTGDTEPVRIPWALVRALRPGEVQLGITAGEAKTLSLETWAEQHVTGLIPGSGRSAGVREQG